MVHLPVLRAGREYRSIDTIELAHVRTGEPLAQVSQANAGLVSRDLLEAPRRRQALTRLPVARLLEICRRAGELFVSAELPLDEASGATQTPEPFVSQQSGTTGLPQSLCRANMEKTRFVLAEMETVLGGLTRGLSLEVLDAGWAVQDGRMLSYSCQADVLGGVLPSNSPGVHSLWLPAIPLKVPLALKPGRQEPWTPSRVFRAFLAAGCPPEALSFYPCDHAGAAQILMRSDRSMLFGDESTVGPWRGDPRVQLHGTGWSKVILGQDRVDDWRSYLDLMETSIAENGGRACLNASGVWVPRHGREIAEALAQRLVRIEAKPLDDPAAKIAAFSNPQMADRFSEYVDNQLKIPGAEDVTARYRKGDRVVELDGCKFVLPTLICCDDPEHPLARTELLFPFAAVVQVPQQEMLSRIGSTLVATAVTDDAQFRAELMAARNIDRLNLGEFPSSRISWDQPHEGNLFEHLYRQRAFQVSSGGSAA